ncbi:MAG: hypothetical protein AB8H80_18800 [Planctomycetota bacterium]
MGRLIDFLLNQPLVLFLIGAWLIGLVGNVQKARKKSRERAERRKRQVEADGGAKPATVDTASTARTASSGNRGGLQPVKGPVRAGPQSGGGGAQPPVAARRGAPTAMGRAGSDSQPAVAQQRSPQTAGPASQQPQQAAEEVAREMRRILGLEPKTEPAASPRPVSPRPPAAPSARREPEPIRRELLGSERDQLRTRVDPHVGESLRDRHVVRDRSLQGRSTRPAMGSLGGRTTRRKKVETKASRFALDDLRKAIVLNEILSPPRAMRPLDD